MRVEKTKKLKHMILAALMMSMIVVLTFSTRIPVPATQGYIHLGDCMLIMAVIILGGRYGAAAAAFGAALADFLGGYAYFAPVSFVAKGAAALVLAWFLEKAIKMTAERTAGAEARRMTGSTALVVAGFVMSCAVMTGCYYLAESFMYGNFIIPLAEIPMNLLQYGVGAVIARVLDGMLEKTALGRNFACRIS